MDPLTSDATVLLQQFFQREQRVTRAIRRLMWCAVAVLLVLNAGAAIGRLSLTTYAMSTVVAATVVGGLSVQLRHRQHLLDERLAALLDRIDLDWSALEGMPLSDDERDAVHQAFTRQFQAQPRTNEAYLRIRGSDRKGPAFEERGSSINVNNERVDPALHEADYDGLEDELRVGERLLEEAEERYTAEAQRQWAIAEARDMDNIEAGVKRLGDLVASGWFERNAKDGAMAELMEDSDSQAQP